MLEISLPYPPTTGNHSSAHVGGRHFTVPAIRRYHETVAYLVSAANLCRRLVGPLAVVYVLHAPDKRARDGDNVEKIVADSLTRANLWVDDSNKVIKAVDRSWGEPVKGGRVFVRVTNYTGETK